MGESLREGEEDGEEGERGGKGGREGGREGIYVWGERELVEGVRWRGMGRERGSWRWKQREGMDRKVRSCDVWRNYTVLQANKRLRH